ncbi:hypothetical protein [Nostoc sp. MG11]|uniref:hypothetical protein n=1 Tax=Nostoc sp. MG11 TaxID=2721166 RepID=UPI001D01B239|nr:hypothetical protein [Nostoc sp. MG11]
MIKVGHTQITLRSELGELIDLPVTELESKIRLGQITVNRQMYAGSNPDELNSILRSASQKDLEDANRRYRNIEPILLGQKIENPTVPERTLAYAYIRSQWVECISEYYAAFK